MSFEEYPLNFKLAFEQEVKGEDRIDKRKSEAIEEQQKVEKDIGNTSTTSQTDTSIGEKAHI